MALLAKALSQIADALPRIEFSAMIYQTDRMESALENVYAYLIKFFIRAIQWYQESPLQHILHSITRPPELRYHDLLEEIDCHSRRIDQLAISGSQAEVRAMHVEINDARATLMDMKKMMAGAFMIGHIDIALPFSRANIPQSFKQSILVQLSTRTSG